MKRVCNAIVCAFLTCLLLMSGCGAKNDLAFEGMAVECKKSDVLFFGRSVHFRISGSVKNETKDSLGVDSMPKLSEDKEGGKVFEPRLSRDELPPNETCEITYEGDLYVSGSDVSHASFSSELSTSGLDEIEESFDSSVDEMAAEFAEEDAEAEAKKKETEKRRQEEQEAKQKQRDEVEGSKGKTAKEAAEAAKEAGYSASFMDAEGVDVTSKVEDATGNSKIIEAEVMSVEIRDTLFLGTSVEFKLDYVDPEAKAEREAEEKRKAEEEKARKDVENAVGKTAGEVMKAAKTAGYNATFLDSESSDVTSKLEEPDKNSEVINTKVKDVKIDEQWNGDIDVRFTLDYVDKEAKKQREAAEKKRKEDEKARKDEKRKNGDVDSGLYEEDFKELETHEGESVAEVIDVINAFGCYDFDFLVPGDRKPKSAGYATKYTSALNRLSVLSIEKGRQPGSSTRDKRPSFTLKLNDMFTIMPEDDQTLLEALTTPEPSDELIERFNEKFTGVMIEFDGCVVDATKASGIGYYDYEIRYGRFDEQGAGSARMAMKHVDNLGTGSKHKRVTPEGQDAIGGTYHFVCEVKSYYNDSRYIGLDKQFATSKSF